jgi:hypothetical protein
MAVAMPKKKADEGRGGMPPPPKDDKGKPQYTTLRIYADDGERLSDLAGKRNVTIAELYRELVGKRVTDLLIEATREQLKRLEGGQ